MSLHARVGSAPPGIAHAQPIDVALGVHACCCLSQIVPIMGPHVWHGVMLLLMLGQGTYCMHGGSVHAAWTTSC